MADEVQFIGDKALINALKKLGAEATAVVEDAATAGGEVIAEAARRNAPRNSGRGADSIDVFPQESSDVEATVAVGPDKEFFYMRFQEFGVGGAEIEPRLKKALEIVPGTIRAKANRGGIPAQPFLRPAFDGNIEAATKAVGDEIKKKLGL